MINIQKDELYIKEIYRAVYSTLPRRYIPKDKERTSDGFILTLEGSCHFVLKDGSELTAKPGNIMYLAQGEDYSMQILTDTYRYIPCVFLFDTSAPRQSLLLRPQNPQLFRDLFHKLVTSMNTDGVGRKQQSMAILYTICSSILRENAQYLPGSLRSRMQAACQHIKTHISDPRLKVSELARQAQMSEVYFRKQFALLYQESPSRYILHERVRYAGELMAFPELRLEDIALQAGFSSLSHMCKVFRSVTGSSPGAYRRQTNSPAPHGSYR